MPTGVLIAPYCAACRGSGAHHVPDRPGGRGSWAAEPARRRLEVEFGGDVAITYVMAGLAREFADPAAARAGDPRRRGVASRMPADVRLWLGGRSGRAPSSSYPACLAVKAAAEQGLDGPVLRRLREGFLVDCRAQDTTEAAVGGRPRRARPGPRPASASTCARTRSSRPSAPTSTSPVQRPRPLPAWRVGERWLEGETGVAALRDAALRGRAPSRRARCPSAEDAVRRLGRAATAEVAAACDLPGPRASAELWRLATEWRVRPEAVAGGELWRAA